MLTHPLTRFADGIHLNTSRLADPAAAGIILQVRVGPDRDGVGSGLSIFAQASP